MERDESLCRNRGSFQKRFRGLSSMLFSPESRVRKRRLHSEHDAEVFNVLLQQEQRHTLSQRIDPKIILANSILQLTTMELVQTIETELLENPALETMEETGCMGDCLDPSNCPFCAARRQRDAELSPQSETPDTGDPETEYESLFEMTALENEEEYDLVSNLEAEVTLQEHLRSLLRTAAAPEDYWIGEYLINCLDDRGWLGNPIEEIAAELDVPISEVCRLLDTIQSFDPPGVGARDLQECLLLQLQYLRETDSAGANSRINAIATQLVRENWDHVCGRRYAKMARSAGISQDDARQSIAYIRNRLNPFPASQFRSPWSYNPTNSKSTVRPDVVIRRTQLGYEVDVLGVEPFSLCVNPAYREEYTKVKSGSNHHTEEERKHFTEYVERAELFIRNVVQRRHTLRLITRSIIEHQTGFLETGSRQFLRPLTRTRIAEKLKMHESTVSRATANKYVQLPNQEVVGFDIFFNSSLSIKDSILQLLQEEDPSNPLSDKRIAELLRERGIDVERRTIVKYRESLKILSSTRRRS